MKLSYIEDFEIEKAKEIVKKQFNFELPEIIGDNILVKIYIREEEIKRIIDVNGNEVKLYWDPEIRERDKYKSCAALVLDISPSIVPEDLSYRVGDFLCIPRNEGVQISYGGHVFHVLDARKIYSILKEPEFLERSK